MVYCMWYIITQSLCWMRYAVNGQLQQRRRHVISLSEIEDETRCRFLTRLQRAIVSQLFADPLVYDFSSHQKLSFRSIEAMLLSQKCRVRKF